MFAEAAYWFSICFSNVNEKKINLSCVVNPNKTHRSRDSSWNLKNLNGATQLWSHQQYHEPDIKAGSLTMFNLIYSSSLLLGQEWFPYDGCKVCTPKLHVKKWWKPECLRWTGTKELWLFLQACIILYLNTTKGYFNLWWCLKLSACEVECMMRMQIQPKNLK